MLSEREGSGKISLIENEMFEMGLPRQRLVQGLWRSVTRAERVVGGHDRDPGNLWRTGNSKLLDVMSGGMDTRGRSRSEACCRPPTQTEAIYRCSSPQLQRERAGRDRPSAGKVVQKSGDEIKGRMAHEVRERFQSFGLEESNSSCGCLGRF